LTAWIKVQINSRITTAYQAGMNGVSQCQARTTISFDVAIEHGIARFKVGHA
jgi:hypothetical protein